ncbi:hypothetical protein AC1031_011050 [Aphanomyces cochlioides]|nr:hypothetical protein AC1031_011050 [Aphanomyces cochlioides]
MTEQVAELKATMKEWNEMEHRIQQNIASMRQVVTLDVGGMIFKTSKGNLLRDEGSYFHALLGSGLWKPDCGSDAYFLDLPAAHHFHRIMDYLRTGALSCSGLSESDVAQLQSNLEYLNLERALAYLPSVWTWELSGNTNGLTLSPCKRSVTAVKRDVRACSSILGNMPRKVFRICLEIGSSSIDIGLASRGSFNSNATRHNESFMIDMRSGALFSRGRKLDNARSSMFMAGDYVTVRQADDRIYFEKNDEEIGVITAVDSTLELFPAATLYAPGSKLTIVSLSNNASPSS